ncbi:MAG: hypothetical protein IT331_19135 [Anaerolineae bacterium]|nr:hypothetical protein [Anaerolineae bacterium]
MRSGIIALTSLILLSSVAACGGSDSTPSPSPTPTQAAQAAVVVPTATLFVANPDGVRRAPTIAPTEIPTVVPSATATTVPTALPTATALPTNTSTALPVAATVAATGTRPAPTGAPQLAPGVYVTAFRVDPPAPKTKPAQFFFTVNFLNTVGEPVNYPLWRVLIFRKGETNSIGDPQGVSKTIAIESSQQTTLPTAINVTSCESFVAQPVWQDEEGRRIPLNMPDGSSVTLEFQVCP